VITFGGHPMNVPQSLLVVGTFGLAMNLRAM
jgi:hypothetical protein